MLNPKPNVRPLDCVLQNPDILQNCIDACHQGQIEALNRQDPNMPRNYCGTEAYFETVRFLCSRLIPLGYLREEVLNQIRLISSPDESGQRHRLLVCHGEAKGSIIRVNTKGYLTDRLVNTENSLHVPHLNLFPEQEYPPKNIWIVFDAKKMVGGEPLLNVTLALPYPLAKGGKEFQCYDWETLYDGELNPLPVTVQEKEEGADIFPVIKEKNSTND